jgi:HK97 family phage prohead protease
LDDDFLSLIRERQNHGGIQLASAYVDTVWSCLGDDRCAKKWGDLEGAALDTACKEAESRPVYRNAEMVVKGGWHRLDADGAPKLFGNAKQLRKSTPKACMDFDCVLTATIKDRDGDVLESRGAKVDPMMPLLWQHIPLQPIGKFISLMSQDDKRLVAHFAILDNEFGRDAAELVEFGALRMSHGFRPIAFEPLKKDKTDVEFQPGWRVREFEIMEASLVSVPSNVESIITAFSRNKLHSPLIKGYAQALYERRPSLVVGGFDATGTVANPCACGKAICTCKAKALGDDSASGGTEVTPAVNVPAGICKSPGCTEKAMKGSDYCVKHAKKSFSDWYEHNKNLVIPVRILERLCPDCATKAKAKGLSGIKVSAFKEPANMDALCGKLEGEEHPFTACTEMVSGWDDAPDDVDAFCGWLTSSCGLKSYRPIGENKSLEAIMETKATSSRAKNLSLMKESHDLFGETHDHPKTGDGHKAMCKSGMEHLKTAIGKPDDDDDDDDDGKKSGRVMSTAKMESVKAAYNMAAKMADDSDMHRPGKSMMREAKGYLKAVVMSANPGVTDDANPGVTGGTNPETNVEGTPGGKAIAAMLLGHLYKRTPLDLPTLCALEEAVPVARQQAEEELLALVASE